MSPDPPKKKRAAPEAGRSAPPSPSEVPGSARLSPARRRLFLALTAAVPVVFFVLLEAALRVSGIGADRPLFVPVSAYPDYEQPSDSVAGRYFAAARSLPTIPHDSFRSEKDSAGLRIVIQGGSSAAGYPFYFGGSIGDLLEQRLLQTYPGRSIEVVGTAMAAVNSYTLLDLAPEIIEIEPDAVLIYAGHNEYYGALGVGSAETLGRSPRLVRLYLRLARFRTVQALRGLLSALASIGQTEVTTSGTLMEQVVREQSIPIGSPLFQDGMAQFQSNLSRLLDAYRAAGIPVFISTVASNERDHAPFVSAARTEEADRRQAALLESARRQGAAGDTTGAARLVAEAIAVDSTAAAPFFMQARLFETMGRPEDARRGYIAAKDRDQLRFRAPEAANRIIRAEADRTGAFLVDGRAALADASPAGIIGGRLMTEHLHPTIHGYFLVADAFYQAVVESGVAGEGGTPVDTQTARGETLVTEVDSLVGALRVRQLMASWPFRPRGTIPSERDTLSGGTVAEGLANDVFLRRRGRTGALRVLRQHHLDQGDYRSALRAALALIQRYPYRAVHYFEAGAVLLQGGQAPPALAYAEAGLDREESADGRRLAGIAELRSGRPEAALSHLDIALAAQDEDRDSRYWRAVALASVGRLDEADREIDRLVSSGSAEVRVTDLAARLRAARNRVGQ